MSTLKFVGQQLRLHGGEVVLAKHTLLITATYTTTGLSTAAVTHALTDELEHQHAVRYGPAYGVHLA